MSYYVIRHYSGETDNTRIVLRSTNLRLVQKGLELRKASLTRGSSDWYSIDTVQGELKV